MTDWDEAAYESAIEAIDLLTGASMAAQRADPTRREELSEQRRRWHALRTALDPNDREWVARVRARADAVIEELRQSDPTIKPSPRAAGPGEVVDEVEDPNIKVFTIDDFDHLLPPAEGLCQQCAKDHEPELPHDQQSLFWQYWFRRQRGRWPTWGDAMAHCTPEMRAFWRERLLEFGVAEAELAEGE